MLQAVIFDLDGTLANTIPAIREGVNLTMAKYGYPLHTDDDILRFINHGARELIRRAMPEALRGDEEQVTRVLADYDVLYGTVYHHTDKLYDGVENVLWSIRNEPGLKIAVLSNKQDQFVRRLCDQLLPSGLCQHAQGVIAGKPSKPNPYLAGLVSQALNVPLCDCVIVGDSDVDIRTAREAGMAHIGVSWGYRSKDFLLQNGAIRVADTPPRLYEMIKSMMKQDD